jgi:hypothetical protein
MDEQKDSSVAKKQAIPELVRHYLATSVKSAFQIRHLARCIANGRRIQAIAWCDEDPH